jgi:hypothetical protein
MKHLKSLALPQTVDARSTGQGLRELAAHADNRRLVGVVLSASWADQPTRMAFSWVPAMLALLGRYWVNTDAPTLA